MNSLPLSVPLNTFVRLAPGMGLGVGVGAAGNPLITGLAYPGETLSSTLARQWLINGSAVSGETGSTFLIPYTASPGDEISQSGSNVVTVLDYVASLSPFVALDASAGVLKSGGSQASYTDAVATWEHDGSATSAAQATVGNQPFYLPDATVGYLHIPAVAGNYASVPSTGWSHNSFDWRFDVEILSTTGNLFLLDARATGVNFGLRILGQRLDALMYGGTGATSTVDLGTGRLRLRVTRDSVAGSIKFYSRSDNALDDDSGWTQLGATATGSTGAITYSTSPRIGESASGTASSKKARIFRVLVKELGGASATLDVGFSLHGSTKYVCTTGQIVEVFSSGADPACVIGKDVVRADGSTDLMTGTSVSDLDPEYAMSLYRNRTTGKREIRESLVSSSEIISTSGTTWSVLSGVAADIERLYVFPSSITATQKERVRRIMGSLDFEIDLFLQAGQSNALGTGTVAASPTIPTDGSVTLWRQQVVGVDPYLLIPMPAEGSSMPGFAVRWNQLTGRNVAFAKYAKSGTAQAAAADNSSGNWDVSGTLYTIAKDRFIAARNFIQQQGQTPVLRGVFWCQGEREGEAIDEAMPGVTKAVYKAALQTMIGRFRTDLGDPNLPFLISRTGRKQTGDTAGWLAVREAQEETAAEMANVHIVFTGALGFTMADLYHYTDAEYLTMGTSSAEAAFAAAF